MDMTLAQKQALQQIVESGSAVATVAYNPNTVTVDPESDAIAAGWIEYTRQDSTNLVEVIYTK